MKKTGHSACDSIICPLPFPMITIELQYTAEILYAYIPFYHKFNKIDRYIFSSSRHCYENSLILKCKFEIIEYIMTALEPLP